MVDYLDPDGETGKRFLTRRPVQGGGRLASRFGYRVHPIFKTRRLHTGVDLAAKTGTPIYAAGDGVIEKAQWVSGYGRYTEIRHVNGFETGYGHQTRFAEGIKAGRAGEAGPTDRLCRLDRQLDRPAPPFRDQGQRPLRRPAQREAAARQVAERPVRRGLPADHLADPRPDGPRRQADDGRVRKTSGPSPFDPG